MTRLTRAQQKAAVRARERAWRERYALHREMREELDALDVAVRHPAGTAYFATGGSEGVGVSARDIAILNAPDPALDPEPRPTLAAFFDGSKGDHLWVGPVPISESTETEQLLADYLAEVNAWVADMDAEDRSTRRWQLASRLCWLLAAGLWAVVLIQEVIL